MKKILFLFALASLGGCVAPPVKQDLSAFVAAAPRSILIVPVVNKSLDVDAPNYVLATLPIPVAEKGYYVFPVNTSKYVLEQEGFYEGERIQNESPTVLAKLFDADAILYVTIHRWDAQYAIISTSVTVEFEYRMVSKDGTEIWKQRQKMVYTPQQNNSGSPLAQLIAAAVSAAMARAAPNFIPLAQQANRQAFITGVHTPPDGPYRVIKVK